MKFIRLCASLSLLCLFQAQSCHNTLTNRMHNLMAGQITGGTYGFLLRELAGNTLATYNSQFVFYPASSIKVLQHIHAIRAIQQGNATASDVVRTFERSEESCADTHAGHRVTTESLLVALDSMMRESDNERTNAVQEFFGNGSAAEGRRRMNETAYTVLNLSPQTALHHKFGCGGVDGPAPNTLTLDDLTKMYEMIANGTVLTNTHIQLFDRHMDNVAGLRRLIEEEGRSLGIDSTTVRTFWRGVQSRAKAGNLRSDRYQSNGGWIRLPTRSGTPKQYVFGVFINKATTVQSGRIRTEATYELLRTPIRDALLTYR